MTGHLDLEDLTLLHAMNHLEGPCRIGALSREVYGDASDAHRRKTGYHIDHLLDLGLVKVENGHRVSVYSLNGTYTSGPGTLQVNGKTFHTEEVAVMETESQLLFLTLPDNVRQSRVHRGGTP